MKLERKKKGQTTTTTITGIIDKAHALCLDSCNSFCWTLLISNSFSNLSCYNNANTHTQQQQQIMLNLRYKIKFQKVNDYKIEVDLTST